MKKVLSLILALVMLLAMFTMVGATEGPDAAAPTEAPVEPAPQADTPEAPAEPVPEVTETVTEPAAEPNVEPVADPTAEPVVEPTEEPAAPPADNGVAPISEPAPEPTPLPTVDVHANGGYFPAPRTGYEKLTVTLKDGKLPKTDVDGYAEPGWYTPLRDGWTFKGWYTAPETTGQPIREGDPVNGAKDLYAGWDELPHTRTVTLNANPGYISRNAAAEGLYSDWVGAAEKQDAGLDWDNGVTMINIALTKDGKLPAEVAGLEMVRGGWTFIGWYTQPPTEQLVSEDGYSYWTTKTNGQQVQPGNAVGEGTQVLYAAYDYAAGSESGKKVTFYLDWNGIEGRWGHCLSVTRPYDDGNVRFTAADALVIGLNYKADNGITFEDTYGAGDGNVTWNNLKAFWDGKTFKGYTFKGWSTTPEGEPVWEDQAIKDGETCFYAQWEKDGNTSKEFADSGRVDPAAGPLTGLRIVGGLDSSMSASVHAGEGAAFTLSLFRSPVRAEAKDVTWTVDVVKAASSPTEVFKNKKETITVKADETKSNADEGIMLKAEGLNLTITCVNGEAYSVTVSAAATGKDDKTKTTDSAATVSFYHTAGTWAEQLAPTCVKSGVETTNCTVCGKELSRKIVPLEHQWKFEVTKAATCTTDGLAQDKCTRCGVTFEQYQTGADKDVTPPDPAEVIPATGHTFKVMSTAGSVNGARLLNEQCEVCQEEETVLCGDVNDDGGVNIVDLYAIYSYVLGETNDMTKMLAGDVNVDGTTNVVDLYKVYSYVLGEVPSL